MAPGISTAFAVSEADGDLGDPRGAIDLVSAPCDESASMDGSCAMACNHCGALLRLMLIACAPKPVGARDDPGVTMPDSVRCLQPPLPGA